MTMLTSAPIAKLRALRLQGQHDCFQYGVRLDRFQNSD